MFDNEPTDPNTPNDDNHVDYGSLWQANDDAGLTQDTPTPAVSDVEPLPVEPLPAEPLRPAAVVIPRADIPVPTVAPAPESDPTAITPTMTPTVPTPTVPTAPVRDPHAVTLRIPASAPRFEPPPPSAAVAPLSTPSPWQAPSTPPAPTPMQPPTANAGLSAPVMPAAPPVTFSPPTIAPATPEKKKRSVGKWLLGAVAGAALLVGGFFLGSALQDEDSTVAPVIETVAADDTIEDTAVVTDVAEDVPVAVEIQSPSLEPVVDVAARVAESVVRIDVGGEAGPGGLGSGIVYADDYIVTNAHVVGTATDVIVTLSNGFSVEGVVVGADAETDVAVVQVTADVDLVPAVFASPESIRVGQLAVAIGSPFGLSQTVTAGIVSSDRRPVRGTQIPNQNTAVPMIQTDAPINPGNSGGALVDAQGRIIGMNTLIRTDGESVGNIGVGFAIASDIVAKVADGLIAGEPVQPSVLGVSGSNQDIGVEPGAVIARVEAGSAAADAGLQIGDRVVLFDGVEIQSMDDLAATVRLSDAGVPLGLSVVREGELLELTVALNTRAG